MALRFAAFASLRFSRIRRSFSSFAIPPDHDYFRHSNYTWLFNAEKQYSNRYLEFNVPALIDEAVRAANASSCVHFSKLRDEAANRLFEITLDNGQELIAKLPYPIAGPAHYTTASEVATMQFMRDLVEVPVPKVLAWSSHSESTPVKSEYIIMEKLKGKFLGDPSGKPSGWDDLRPDEVTQIIREIAQIELRMTNMYFKCMGSLYYTKDIPHGVRSIKLSGFPGDELYCIGPSVDRRFWRNGRGELNINRGPWDTYLDYIQSVIDCETAWLKKYAKPHQQDSPLFRSERENDPETHIKLLEKYALIFPSLVVPEFNYFKLWHPNFESENILTYPIDGQHRITGILSWQEAIIDSFAVIAESPPPCLRPPDGYISIQSESDDQSGDDQLDESTELPRNFWQMIFMKRVADLEEVKRYNEYTAITKEINPSLHNYRNIDTTSVVTKPQSRVSYTWDYSLPLFEKSLIDICSTMEESDPPDTRAPISFSSSEIKANETAVNRYFQQYEAWELFEEIDVGPDGEVEQDKLEEARESMEAYREEYLDTLPESDQEDARRRWPFQDGALSITAETSRTPQIHSNLNHESQ